MGIWTRVLLNKKGSFGNNICMFVFICVCVYICTEKKSRKILKVLLLIVRVTVIFPYFFIPLCIVRTALQDDESEALKTGGGERKHMTMGAIQILRPNWNVLTATININATASQGPGPVTANSLCAHKLSEVVKSGETVTVEASWPFPSGVSPHTALSCYDLIFAPPHLPQYSWSACWCLVVSLLAEKCAELSGECRRQWRGACSARRMTSRKACPCMTCPSDPGAHMPIRTQPGEAFNTGYLASVVKSETAAETKSSLYFFPSFSFSPSPSFVSPLLPSTLPFPLSQHLSRISNMSYNLSYGPSHPCREMLNNSEWQAAIFKFKGCQINKYRGYNVQY